MGKPVRLGMLTPSSNTVLEPMTQAMLVNLPGVSAHFSRFRVTEISLALPALDQFDKVVGINSLGLRVSPEKIFGICCASAQGTYSQRLEPRQAQAQQTKSILRKD